MTKHIEDGGPAFPILNRNIGYHADIRQVEKGLSVRDWFAANAPARPEHYRPYSSPDFPKPISISDAGTPVYDDAAVKSHMFEVREITLKNETAWRYAFADAMIAARKDGVA